MTSDPGVDAAPLSTEAVRPAPFGQSLDHVKLVIELLYHSGREDPDAISPLLHEDFRVVAIPGLAPDRGYQSRAEFLAYFGEARRAGRVIRPDVTSIQVLPNGAVLVEGRLLLTADEVPHEMRGWFVYTFGDNVIATLGNYADAESARRAAWLSQPSA